MFVSRTPLRQGAELGKATGTPYDARGGVKSGTFALLWPNTTINIMPGPANIYILGFTPVDARTTIGYKDYYVADGIPAETFREMTEYFDFLGQEDRVLVESVQRGLDSGRVPYGRLILHGEEMVARFQDMVRRAGVGV